MIALSLLLLLVIEFVVSLQTVRRASCFYSNRNQCNYKNNSRKKVNILAMRSSIEWEDETWEDSFSIIKKSFPATAEGMVKISDEIDKSANKFRANMILRWKRQLAMASILKRDRDEYITISTFLGNRIPRQELPNLQNIPFPTIPSTVTTATADAGVTTADTVVSSSSTANSFGVSGNGEEALLPDCELPAKRFDENPLEKLLLSVFRGLVQKETGYKSEVTGILGLLEEGRHYMLSEEGQADDSVNQHTFVKNVLAGLLTPFLPPFYRIFMAGIVPSRENGDPVWLEEAAQKAVNILPDVLPFKNDLATPGKQLGPTFYAPLLTSLVSPVALSFLLGPARVNLRKDGQFGGMVVEKCKFLQESNCKGLCLHQCKIPAQEYFKDTLGVPVTVVPNFETQECQWSWGETPVPHREDPDFPKGCITGCETRLQMYQ